MKLTDIAALCRDDTVHPRVLDGLAFKALHHREGDEWFEHPLDGVEVWHRRCREDAAAMDTPPPVSTEVDAALAEKIPGMRLSSLREHLRADGADASWRAWGATIVVGHLFTTDGAASNPARAMLEAILLAHARLLDDGA